MQVADAPISSLKQRKNPLPRRIVGIAAVLIVASWIPLTLIARGRVSNSQEPRYQFMLDMAKQPKYREEAASDVFADGRAMRPKVTGTVARGQLDEDDHYFRGFLEGSDPRNNKPEAKFYEGLPKRVKVTEALLRRGQDRFNIYCAVCHGLDGYGNGAVNQRAFELAEVPPPGRYLGWRVPSSFHTKLVRARPDGHIFNTITNGIRNMPGYAAQISVEDRWAIVAYVRALQISQDPAAALAEVKK